MPDKFLLTPDEAAKAMSIGRTGVYGLIQRGELASLKVGGSRRVPVHAIEEFISNNIEGKQQ